MNIKVLLNSCCCAIAIIYKNAALNYAKNELGLQSDVLIKPMKGDEDLDIKLQNNTDYFKLVDENDFIYKIIQLI